MSKENFEKFKNQSIFNTIDSNEQIINNVKRTDMINPINQKIL